MNFGNNNNLTVFHRCYKVPFYDNHYEKVHIENITKKES